MANSTGKAIDCILCVLLSNQIKFRFDNLSTGCRPLSTLINITYRADAPDIFSHELAVTARMK
jgi:hypothetical protein